MTRTLRLFREYRSFQKNGQGTKGRQTMLRDGAYRMATKGKERKAMDLTTLLIVIVVLVLLFGGGGYYWRGRRR
jgi:hypothetical protein